MKLTTLPTLVTLLCTQIAFAQKSADSLLQLGKQFYVSKEYAKAAPFLAAAADSARFRVIKNEYYLYAAHAFAKVKDSANSFKYLQQAITQYGYNDLSTLQGDDSFEFMHSDKRWQTLIKSIKPTYTTDPRKAKFIDADVINFWKAYDSVQKTPEQAEAIFNSLYFEKGTNALQFYYANKIRNARSFVKKQNRLKKYYPSIRSYTFKTPDIRSTCIKSFIKLKSIYPQAIFPHTYFVVGSLSSGGTVSGDGLILGIDQAVMAPDTDTTGLTLWEYKNISKFTDLPHTVAHELIHFQQKQMAGDTTLLAAAIGEGMADFMGELISGRTSNARLHVYAAGKERELWQAFEKEMYLNRAHNWIANSNQETADKPADLGYWIGYQICKAYYEQATDKKQAIYDMLHIKDYKAFLLTSRVAEKFN